MFESLIAKLPHLKQQLEEFTQLYERIEVPAKTILLREGQVSKRSFFIEKGCIRAWLNHNGKDVTFQFFFEQEGLSSAESFRKNIPSVLTIETIEPSIIHVLHKKDYEYIMQKLGADTAFLKEMIEIIFERQLHYVKEFISFIRDTPQQRYLNLLQQKPHIVQRIPQHYIASYLGITSVHLSRIRNKLMKENK
ncbi:MAG TPA: Crp/Fnr family transcriptional regulator [Parafilimonas sp.]|nr:Crp/Fnr family transcriptional regulator [Parafilimonas sp.]